MLEQMRSEKKARKRLNTTSGALLSTLPLVKMVCLQGLVLFQYGEWKAARPWGRGWSALLLVTVVVLSHRYPKLTRKCRCCGTEML